MQLTRIRSIHVSEDTIVDHKVSDDVEHLEVRQDDTLVDHQVTDDVERLKFGQDAIEVDHEGTDESKDTTDHKIADNN